MLKPPQLAPLDLLVFYSELPPDVLTPHPILRPAQGNLFSGLHEQACSFGWYCELMTIDKSLNVIQFSIHIISDPKFEILQMPY